MRMIRPKLVAPQITIAEEQDEYKPVTAAMVRNPLYHAGLTAVSDSQIVRANGVVLAFRPSDEERAKIAAGSDIYVNLLTFLKPMQPILVDVGPENMAEWFGVEVEP
jgi:hypothetical protein